MMILDNNYFNTTDVDFIRANENVESKGKIHSPIAHSDVLTKFRQKADIYGLTLCEEMGGLSKDGNKFIYVAQIKDESHPDYALSIGFRNNNDKSLAFNCMLGHRIFVCCNGCCTSIVKPSKMRHTIGNVERNALLDTKIEMCFDRFLEDSGKVHEQIGLMKNTPLTDEIVGRFVKGMVGSHTMGAANVMRVIEELENPTLNNRDDSSVFRLLNAGTYITSHKIKNPSQGVMASREINNLLMRIINPTFRPLGDVFDADSEVVD